MAASVDDEDLAPGGKNIAEFATYEDFLSSQVSERDINYLDDINVAQKLIELGIRGTEGFSEDQFNAAKATIELRKAFHNVKNVISAGRTFEEPMLRALQMREEGNRTGKNSSIFFIRDRNESGAEISGYVDYSHRLMTDDFRPIFDGIKKFLPRKSDLSFFNWETQNVSSRASPNYEIIATSPTGMVFRNKRDGKFINPDPFVGYYGDNTSRTVVPTTAYISVIVFDHYNRRRV